HTVPVMWAATSTGIAPDSTPRHVASTSPDARMARAASVPPSRAGIGVRVLVRSTRPGAWRARVCAREPRPGKIAPARTARPGVKLKHGRPEGKLGSLLAEGTDEPRGRPDPRGRSGQGTPRPRGARSP